MGTLNQSASPDVGVSLPARLENKTQLAQILARLVQDPSIQAALILRGKDLWAQAGELLELPAPAETTPERPGAEQAATELARKVFQYWATDGSSDLTRYVRLTSVPGEYILYATGLMGEMVLAILFTEETPFSQMRAKAAQLAHTLLSSPLQEEKASWIQNSSEGAQDDNPALETAPTNAVQPVLLPQKAPTAPASPASTLAEPRVSLAASTAIPLTPQPVILQGTPPTSIPQMPPLDHNETISSPLPGRAEIPNMGPTSRPADYTSGAPAASASWMPAASPVISDLYLAIVLLPRMPKHHLTGDLATLLPQWIAQVCVAYGWRLETLHIRPEYVGWVVNIPPSTSASQHLRIMRRQTSQYIFGEFPTIARENPSGEFWAPGYLVTSSSQLPTEGVIQAFINQVRRQQGVSKPFPDQA